ncbi:MAG: hypothetical protein SFZ03_03130 [Candidatus Melainabacteria bacterium]|nr:hypothetical protein [Candidatus Melainabacteria bacterium]
MTWINRPTGLTMAYGRYYSAPEALPQHAPTTTANAVSHSQFNSRVAGGMETLPIGLAYPQMPLLGGTTRQPQRFGSQQPEEHDDSYLDVEAARLRLESLVNPKSAAELRMEREQDEQTLNALIPELQKASVPAARIAQVGSNFWADAKTVYFKPAPVPNILSQENPDFHSLALWKITSKQQGKPELLQTHLMGQPDGLLVFDPSSLDEHALPSETGDDRFRLDRTLFLYWKDPANEKWYHLSFRTGLQPLAGASTDPTDVRQASLAELEEKIPLGQTRPILVVEAIEGDYDVQQEKMLPAKEPHFTPDGIALMQTRLLLQSLLFEKLRPLPPELDGQS